MAFNPLSGVVGSVKVGATSYAFGKWSIKLKTKSIPVNNFNSNGRQQVVGGVTHAELTLEALTYDQGNMPFSTNATYSFILGYSATQSITVAFFIEEIDVDVDYDGAQPVKIQCTSNDITFSAAIA